MKGKKLLVLAAAVMTMVIVLTGCDSVKYDITSAGSKSTIKINSVSDGDEAEFALYSVGKDRHAVIESKLDKGQLQIDFVEVTVFTQENGPDDVIYHDTVAGTVVRLEEEQTVPLAKGDYVVRLRAVGETNGTVTLRLEKD